jgi:hypothetical protein
LFSHGKRWSDRWRTHFRTASIKSAERISHQFDNYNAALRSSGIESQLVSIFENTSGTYYQQYSDMTNIYEPMILMITQLSARLSPKWVCTTENHHLAGTRAICYLNGKTDAGAVVYARIVACSTCSMVSA